jgi:hypothetical protein
MIDGSQEGSTGAARPLPVGGGVHGAPGAPLLMSSTRLDALIGPLTPSVNDSTHCSRCPHATLYCQLSAVAYLAEHCRRLPRHRDKVTSQQPVLTDCLSFLPAATLAHMAGNSRASSSSGAGGRRPGQAAATSSAADTMDEDDYVMVDGSSIGARAAALLAQQQPPSPSRSVTQRFPFAQRVAQEGIIVCCHGHRVRYADIYRAKQETAIHHRCCLCSLAALRRRGLAAMWHPLTPPATPSSPRVPAARPPPSPRAPAQQTQQQPLLSPAARRQSADLAGHRRPSVDSSASTATSPGAAGLGRAASANSPIPPHIITAGGGAMTAFIGTAAGAAAASGQLPQPRNYGEALEHVAGALESLAAQVCTSIWMLLLCLYPSPIIQQQLITSVCCPLR